MGRFELPTPCSQSRCATKLRHIPMNLPGQERAESIGGARVAHVTFGEVGGSAERIDSTSRDETAGAFAGVEIGEEARGFSRVPGVLTVTA